MKECISSFSGSPCNQKDLCFSSVELTSCCSECKGFIGKIPYHSVFKASITLHQDACVATPPPTCSKSLSVDSYLYDQEKFNMKCNCEEPTDGGRMVVEASYKSRIGSCLRSQVTDSCAARNFKSLQDYMTNCCTQCNGAPAYISSHI